MIGDKKRTVLEAGMGVNVHFINPMLYTKTRLWDALYS